MVMSENLGSRVFDHSAIYVFQTDAREHNAPMLCYYVNGGHAFVRETRGHQTKGTKRLRRFG